MSSDTPLVVRLEVTVPRIDLPELQTPQAAKTYMGQGARPTAGLGHSSKQGNEVEGQIRLLFQETSQFREHHSTIDATSRMVHTLPFRLFQMTVPMPGRVSVYALHILRWRHWFSSSRKHNPTVSGHGNEQMHITDELLFSLEFQQPDTPSTGASLTPGMNQVVILLDSDGVPVSYCIDGAES